MVFLSILADFCHHSLRDWTGEERLLLLLLLLLWIVVVLVVPLVFFFFATMMVLRWNFPNENLELIIEVEEKEEEGPTLREEHCRRRLLEEEVELVAEVVA